MQIRILLFGALSGLIWSSVPIAIGNDRSVTTFVEFPMVGVITGILVSFALYKPLSKFNNWVTILLGILVLPVGSFCFGFCLGLITLAGGLIRGASFTMPIPLIPLSTGVLSVNVAIMLSCFSYFGFIFFPAALLTTYLLRLTIGHGQSLRASL